MRPWFLEDYGNPHSTEHAFGWRAHRAIDCAREQVGDLIGVAAEDILFTSGATESNNLVLFGATKRRPQGRDTILISSIEHASILEPARQLRDAGIRVFEIAVDCNGYLQLDALDELLTDRVFLVSVGFVNNEIGTVQDVVAIGDRCRAVGALFHTDAAQALAAISLWPENPPFDFASLASHKAYGPKGIGGLYIAPGAAQYLSPLLLGGGQQRGLRAGTLPTPLCVGFGAACAKLKQVGKQEEQVVRHMRDEFLKNLRRSIPGIMLNGPLEPRHPGNLNVRFKGVDARDVIQLLQPRIACSTGSACQSGIDEPSHVLLAIGLSHEEAVSSLRFGVGRFTIEREIVEAADALASTAAFSRDQQLESRLLPS